MSHENKLQVKEGHYKKWKYTTFSRFISFFYQIDSIAKLEGVHSILEIGPGSKLVADELKKMGYSVTTCDFDASVTPDVVADVRTLPFKEGEFDCVMACQVLEHIPFADFEKIMDDFAKITKKYVIISLPNRSTTFELVLRIPFINTLFKRNFFDWSIQFPVKFVGFEESGQHYWEIDFWTTSRKKVRTVFERHFTVLKEFQPPMNKYHRFYVLERK